MMHYIILVIALERFHIDILSENWAKGYKLPWLQEFL